MSPNLAKYLPLAIFLILLSILVWAILEIRFKHQTMGEKQRQAKAKNNNTPTPGKNDALKKDALAEEVPRKEEP